MELRSELIEGLHRFIGLSWLLEATWASIPVHSGR